MGSMDEAHSQLLDEKAYQTGNATEHTYRSALQELIETLAQGITATNEPKRVKCGAPDFIITNKHTPLGYIETKDIGVSLDQTERYRPDEAVFGESWQSRLD